MVPRVSAALFWEQNEVKQLQKETKRPSPKPAMEWASIAWILEHVMVCTVYIVKLETVFPKAPLCMWDLEGRSGAVQQSLLCEGRHRQMPW